MHAIRYLTHITQFKLKLHLTPLSSGRFWRPPQLLQRGGREMGAGRNRVVGGALCGGELSRSSRQSLKLYHMDRRHNQRLRHEKKVNKMASTCINRDVTDARALHILPAKHKEATRFIIHLNHMRSLKRI